MVKHIVMWKLKDAAGGRDRHENAVIMKKRIEGLKDKIDVILHIEVGIDVNRSGAAYDVALYSEFSDPDALETYQEHPDHVDVAGFVAGVTEDRVVVDYTV
jgi:hypothetical protein